MNSILFRSALIVTIFVMFAMGCNAQVEDVSQSTDRPVKAADFTLVGVNGETIKLSDYAGKVIILDFWATWCPPCVKEIPHFNELAKEYADEGLVVLGVSVDRGGEDVVKGFMKERIPISYPVAMTNPETYATYQGYIPAAEQGGIPFTFVIDRKGNITQRYVGYRSKEVFIKAIKPLLAG